MKVFEDYLISDSELETRINSLLSGIAGNFPDRETCKSLLGVIDLTSLNGNDTRKKIQDLCLQARLLSQQIAPEHIPAICIYPVHIAFAKKQLKDLPVKVATVAGGFPAGQVPLSVKLCEVKYALDEGADEIDMVINRACILDGNDARVLEEISRIREECRDLTLKVILETGELKSTKHIRKACELALTGGADFLKTSTGKTSPAATLPAFLIMIDTIREYCLNTGIKTGIKAAGGIAEPMDAVNYYTLVQKVLGDSWLGHDKFRIGASRLANALSLELS